jgi:Lrp/AsnC family leucine-responsive transcriptional regulator
MEAYRGVLGLIVDLPGVLQTHTYVVIEQVKQDAGLPLKLAAAPEVKTD